MVKRPERIKVISKRITIEYYPANSAELGEECDGQWFPTEQRIAITDGLKSDLQKATILHEVIHAISDEMGIDLTEAQVEGAAKGILAVLMDNPSFARYLLKKDSA